MAITKNMLKNISLFSVNISEQQWNVSKMKSPYDIWFPIMIQVIYKEDKVCYFNNINIISLMKANNGVLVNRVWLCKNFWSKCLINGLSLKTRSLKEKVRWTPKRICAILHLSSTSKCKCGFLMHQKNYHNQ